MATASRVQMLALASNARGTVAAMASSVSEWSADMAKAANRPAQVRDARRPTGIPASGWKAVGLRVKDQVASDNVSIVSAGVAFYLLLSIVPALAATVAIYGLVADPQSIGRHMAALGQFMPAEAQALVGEQLNRLAQSSGDALGIGALVGLLVSIWSATRAMAAMIESLNIAYNEEERRGFVRRNLVALGLTVVLVLFLGVAIALIAVIPVIVNLLGMTGLLATVMNWLRWPVLAACLLLALAVLYRYGPDREAPEWAWVSPGAVVGGLLWMLGSIGFSIYVSYAGNYDATYGSLGAIVVVMMWLFISAFAIMLGAEWNAETERQAPQR
jgi:membrane protein